MQKVLVKGHAKHDHELADLREQLEHARRAIRAHETQAAEMISMVGGRDPLACNCSLLSTNTAHTNHLRTHSPFAIVLC